VNRHIFFSNDMSEMWSISVAFVDPKNAKRCDARLLKQKQTNSHSRRRRTATTKKYSSRKNREKEGVKKVERWLLDSRFVLERRCFCFSSTKLKSIAIFDSVRFVYLLGFVSHSQAVDSFHCGMEG